MPNAEIKTKELKTNGQFVVEYQHLGYGGCTPVINGKPAPMLTFGYVSKSDYDACCNLIRKAVIACDGDVYKAANYIHNAVLTDAAEIKADEAVMVDDTEMIVSYAVKEIYLGTEKMADLEDVEVENIPEEIIKTMLIDRARLRLAEMETDDCDYWDEEYDEDDLW